ncbi:MAG: hypothetical protein EOP50_10260, partial [Sphingobacteriales bacterium]
MSYRRPQIILTLALALLLHPAAAQESPLISTDTAVFLRSVNKLATGASRRLETAKSTYLNRLQRSEARILRKWKRKHPEKPFELPIGTDSFYTALAKDSTIHQGNYDGTLDSLLTATRYLGGEKAGQALGPVKQQFASGELLQKHLVDRRRQLAA